MNPSLAMRAAASFASMAIAAAFAQTPVAELGKQRAAALALPWQVREAAHPALGPIVFAMLSKPVSTPAGSGRVSSNVYVSCERGTAKMAIELAHGTRPDDPSGLKPKAMPRLTCIAPGDARPEEIEARWTANELGDVMARGLWPSALRACASIGISQEVLLPAGWGPQAARVQLEISPYARELDAVFARCGEPTAYPAQTAPQAPAAPPARPAAAPSHEWITARVTSDGHTNVRARPDIRSPLVIRLDPGDIVLVQKSTGDWWRSQSRPGARKAFEGYIRRDRLVVK